MAKVAGVAESIASRVPNNKADMRVAERTRRRILEVARKLGYIPNRSARTLSVGKAPLVTLVVRQSDHYIISLKAWKLREALAGLDRDVFVSDFCSLTTPEATLNMLLMGAPEAVVLLHQPWEVGRLAELCEDLGAEGVHPLIADYLEPLRADVSADAVGVDRITGVKQAVSHLTELGHCRIALFTNSSAYDRLAGYEQALAEHGIRERFIEVLDAYSPVQADAEAGAQRFLQNNPQVTALFCGEDILALSAMRVLTQMGPRVPEDVAIVGFNDNPWAGRLPVPLTTVAQPVDELCQTAKQLLHQRLEGWEAPWQRVTLTPRLTVRESSGREMINQRDENVMQTGSATVAR